MKTRKNHRKAIGWILLCVSALLFLLLGVTHWILKQPEMLVRQVQHTVSKTEMEVQALTKNHADYSQYAKKGYGLYVFNNDSLLHWNDNTVSPKLIKRKVAIDSDTLCNLLSGDYYIKSFKVGQLDYYVFKLINATYPIENRYFQNGLFPSQSIIHTNIRFDHEGYEIYAEQGKLLGHCTILAPAQLKPFIRKTLLLAGIILGVIGLALLIIKPKKKTSTLKFKLEYAIGIIFLISIVLTYLYYDSNRKRENQEMAALAEQLLKKQDIAFETSYKAFAEQIKSDSTLLGMAFAESNVLADVILGYSKELLFDSTMKSYITNLTVCEPNEEINIQPEDYVVNCDDYFLEKLANNTPKRVGDGLYFMDYYTLDPNYLGKIKITSKDSLQQKNLYFEFYKPIAPEGFGLPQLLKKNDNSKSYDYSVANYRDNLLVYKYGRYVYPNFMNSLKIKDHDFCYTKRYKHYAIIENENNALVISTPTKGWSETTAPFALFFLGLTLPLLLIVWLIRPKEHRKWRDRNFRNRLQTVVFSTLGISFLAIGPVSVIYMQSLYNQKTMTSHFETTRTLSLEMRNDIDFASLMKTHSRDAWTDILQHYSTIFFTDLNLYQLNGQLLATTRPEINELNLQAPIMNAEAYQQMHRNKELYYTHEEYLGKGKYESSYIPISDNTGITLAYLNTPYFSSATDLHNEIKNFILTYLNIILLLLGITLFIILGMTRRLTQPLALIQNKLGDIKIDQKNEPIEWKNNDEIGALVKQYNQLIVELEKSAAELKRTTTETAWRGVARQVAHEIKNSLTPMRLSVQLLQRNIDNGKATPKQIQRTTNTLIEQIDALSDIASSFSCYAKLPENHPQPLDLSELVGNVVHLYNNAENIEFHYAFDKAKDHTYNGDKTNLNSAVGNLVKNAVQAIGSKPNGKIEVTLQSTEKAFIISVKDNGKGIKEEDKDRIFLPNFTTKSGSSGVGLSLTYNIVQAAGGTISFESQENVGTEFLIELPKQNKTNQNP